MSDKNGLARQQQSQQAQQNNEHRRTVAEWTTFGISLGIVLLLLGLVAYQYLTRGDALPAIRVIPQLEETRRKLDIYYVPVEVTNLGGETAAEVRVQFVLEPVDGPREEIGFTLNFLAGAEQRRGIVGFDQDPRVGRLYTNISFVIP